MLRTGPPWMHRTGPLATANVNENFVHHEDVRRASGEGPRAIDPEMDAILWKMLGFGARMSKKAVQGRGVHAAHARRSRASGVDRRRAGDDDRRDRASSTLYMSGRKDAADRRRSTATRRRSRSCTAANFGV